MLEVGSAMTGDAQPDLPHLLRGAFRSARAARVLLEQNFPTDAAARAFQAMYLAACALLDDANEPRTADQAATISRFGFRFVKIGGMDLRHYQSLRRGHELHRLCDCKAEREATADEARELVAAADDLLSEAKRLLQAR